MGESVGKARGSRGCELEHPSGLHDGDSISILHPSATLLIAYLYLISILGCLNESILHEVLDALSLVFLGETIIDVILITVSC